MNVEDKDKDLLKILETHFGRVKVKGSYAFIKSPFNTLDKNPSCVVILKDTHRFSEGFFKDFSTGKTGNIYAMLNIHHDYGFKDKQAKLPQLNTPELQRTHISTLEYSPSEYLFRRGISYETQEEFKVFEIDDHVSMPVFDQEGYFIYNTSRSVEGKVHNIASPTDAYPAFTHAFKTSDTVFVCEAMIDAFTLFTNGLKAISLNGAGNHARLKEVFRGHFGRIVLALDPDEVGQTNAGLIMEMLKHKDVVNIVLPKDVNDTWTGMLKELPPEVAHVVFIKLLERLINGKQCPCMDCGKETIETDYYMVKDDVWLAAVPDENGCGVFFLCRECLAARLGRPLNPDDFTDCPINSPK